MSDTNFEASIQNFMNSGQTPNPWFTIANQFLPRNFHDVIRWSRYILIHSPTITEVIRKQSTYPITDFNFDTKDEKIKEKYGEIAKSFKLKSSLQDIGFDRFTLGNVFVSIYFPIHRSLTCKTCKTVYSAKKAEFLTFKQFQFRGTCPHCLSSGEFEVKDSRSMNIEDMNIIKWDPLNIAVNHNPITGESEFFYKIPNAVKQKIRLGDRLFINTIPWSMIEAVKNNQDFKFDSNNIFHMKNLSLGNTVDGVCIPPLISLFNLVFYQATLRKANESIATEHMTPLRVVYPGMQTQNGDPVVSMSLKNFAANVEDAVKRFKKDKGYFLISPVPIGYQPIGGEGKNLLVAQELQQAEETILLSLGVSRELLSGTTNWTSSTVGLRLLSNMLHDYVRQIEELTNWIFSKVSSYLNIPFVNTKLIPFKLTDDEFLKQLAVNLSASKKMSMSTVYESMNMDYDKELEKIREDTVSEAVNNAKTQFETDRALFIAGKEIGNTLKDSNELQTALVKAQQVAEEFYSYDDGARKSALNQLKNEEYGLYLMVSKLLDEMHSSSEHKEKTKSEGQALKDSAINNTNP